MATTFFRDLVSRKDFQVLPASFTQQRLWFLDRLESNGAIYNVPVIFRLKGLLDLRALEGSLNALLQRHEALRTTFAMMDRQPVQVVAPTLVMPLPVVDLRVFPETRREAEALRLAVEEAQRPFNLADGPLVRATLLRLNEEEYVLLLTTHQIVFDNWSMNVFTRELAVLYKAFSMGKPSSLPDLPMQYADYVYRQREWLRGDLPEAQLSYWKQQLSGAQGILQLPTDRPRSAAQTFERAQQSLVLPKTLMEALQELSRQEGATLFMTLLAAFQILLQRYTGQEDLVLGSSVTNRTRAEVESLVGCCVNTVVLRTNLSGNPSFRKLLARVREAVLGAYANADFPFDRLVDELGMAQNPGHAPLFDVMVNFNDTPRTTFELPGLTISNLQTAEPLSKLPMVLYIEEQVGEISLRLMYQTTLFSPQRINCMLNQMQYLLEQITAAPEKAIRLYSLVTSESVHLLPDPLAVLPEPQYELITQTFAFWVKRAPEQPAVCQGLQTWTYGELAESSYVLAQFLLAQRLEPGDVVAVMGQQSFGLISSMIAVLLAGGVLLPIDWNLPAHRQQLMLREAGAKHLLYAGNWRPEVKWIQELPSLAIFRVDSDKGQLVEPKNLDGEAAQMPVINPDDAAYIFFTSGTTGIPKGVQGCHKGLSHFLSWQRETFAVGPHDRVAQLTGLSFDVVLRDIFLPLTSGATLCLPAERSEPGPDKILPWLEREKITLLHTVPSLAQSWLANLPAGGSLRSLRWVFFAGEPLTDVLVRRWREAFPQAGQIANFYGPTETSLAKCCYMVDADTAPGIQPVGWPLPETQALVLAESNQLCGIGELGEIVLRTPFRSLGYINAPEEYRKRFVKNPFCDDEGDLLYRTGDRGRYSLDGSLEILGRLDHQVKIRGIRVEPDEVMAILQQHPAVRQAVVVAREDVPGDKRLVAYIVTTREPAPPISELRSFLQEQLPEYMLPSTFVFLEAFPLTPNGKVDRRALPAPATRRREQAEDYVAPRTPVEEMLASIWAQVLHLERVGIHDNFFDLGGHSLLVAQIIARLRDTFQIELPAPTIFRSPTIAELAVVIEEMLIDEIEELDEEEAQRRLDEELPGSWSPLVAVQTGGSKQPFFFLHGDFFNDAFYCFHLARNLGPDQPFYALEPYRFDVLGARPTLEVMAAAYLQSLRSVQPEGPYLLGGFCNGGLLAYEMARQLHAEGETVDLQISIDPQPIFYMRGVCRVINRLGRLMRLSESKQVYWFLWLRHMYRYLHHVYRYLRFPRYRRWKTKLDGERADQNDMVILKLNELYELWFQDVEPLGSNKETELKQRIHNLGLALPRLNELFPEALFPTVEALCNDWLGIFTWFASEYEPSFYPGKSTFFFTEGAQEKGWDVNWRKIAEAKDKEVEVHNIAGTHITCKTKYLHDLTECLRTCLSRAQVAKSS